MVTGDTQAAFLNVASTAAQIRAGKIKPIAIVNHRPTMRAGSTICACHRQTGWKRCTGAVAASIRSV